MITPILLVCCCIAACSTENTTQSPTLSEEDVTFASEDDLEQYVDELTQLIQETRSDVSSSDFDGHYIPDDRFLFSVGEQIQTDDDSTFVEASAQFRVDTTVEEYIAAATQAKPIEIVDQDLPSAQLTDNEEDPSVEIQVQDATEATSAAEVDLLIRNDSETLGTIPTLDSVASAVHIPSGGTISFVSVGGAPEVDEIGDQAAWIVGYEDEASTIKQQVIEQFGSLTIQSPREDPDSGELVGDPGDPNSSESLSILGVADSIVSENDLNSGSLDYFFQYEFVTSTNRSRFLSEDFIARLPEADTYLFVRFQALPTTT